MTFAEAEDASLRSRAKPREPRYHPFCSKRCADVDLNRWLSGVYAAPAAEEDDASGEGEGEGR